MSPTLAEQDNHQCYENDASPGGYCEMGNEKKNTSSGSGFETNSSCVSPFSHIHHVVTMSSLKNHTETEKDRLRPRLAGHAEGAPSASTASFGGCLARAKRGRRSHPKGLPVELRWEVVTWAFRGSAQRLSSGGQSMNLPWPRRRGQSGPKKRREEDGATRKTGLWIGESEGSAQWSCAIEVGY